MVIRPIGKSRRVAPQCTITVPQAWCVVVTCLLVLPRPCTSNLNRLLVPRLGRVLVKVISCLTSWLSVVVPLSRVGSFGGDRCCVLV